MKKIQNYDRKRTLQKVLRYAVLLCLACCLSLLAGSKNTSAQEEAGGSAWDPERSVSISIQINDSDPDRLDREFYVFQVACALPNQPVSGSISVELLEDYEETGVTFQAETAAQLLEEIRALRRVIRDSRLLPDAVMITNEEGFCELTGLTQGVYLIIPDNTNGADPIIATSMLILPCTDPDGTWIYDQQIVPKYTPEDDEYFEDGDENETRDATEGEVTTECEETFEDEESTEQEETTEEVEASEVETTVGIPNTNPPTEATTSALRTSESEPPVLGIEDYSQVLGLVMLGLGAVILILLVVVLIIRSKNRE